MSSAITQALKPMVIHTSIRNLGVKNPVACIFRNVKVVENYGTVLDSRINDLMDEMKSKRDAFLAKPETTGFRGIFTKMGYEQLIPAGERLFDAVHGKGFKRIDNIVDSYNIVACESVAGLGMHDATKFLASSDPFVVWRAQGKEQIIPFGREKGEKVKAGDMVYGLHGEKDDLAAWLGKRDKDSNEWKVTAATTSLLFIVLGNENTTEAFNKEICTKTFELLKLTCPEATMEMLQIVDGDK